MSKQLLFLLFIFITSTATAQITITNQDMPSVGDTFRVSNGIITPAIDPVPTGAAFTWDFSMLTWSTQQVDTFVSVSSTGNTYAFVFVDVAFNPYRSNLATLGPAIPTVPGLPITISDVYYFYHNSAQAYQQSGYGANINGIGVPIPFTNKDRVYSFPLDFSDTDSSFSSFQLSLPGFGYYGHEQVRLSEVDGWGSLTTPYGTFNTLRVKSEITAYDTLFADTLGMGFGFALPVAYEYKWLGLQMGIPLLQINTTLSPFGGETVTSIRYRDSLQVTGISEESVLSSFDFSLFPNPSDGNFTMQFATPSSEEVVVSLYSIEGKRIGELWRGILNKGSHSILVNANGRNLSSGVYFIEAQINDELIKKKLIIVNP